MGRGKGGSLSSRFPLAIVRHALSFSFSLAFLQHKEASTEKRGNWHTCNPVPGQYLTHAQSHITRALDSCLDPGEVHTDKSVSMV